MTPGVNVGRTLVGLAITFVLYLGFFSSMNERARHEDPVVMGLATLLLVGLVLGFAYGARALARLLRRGKH